MELLPVKSFQETLHGGYCGPASLKMVFEYYGLEKGEGELAEACNHNTELGVSAEIMAETARKYGFDAEVKNESDFSEIESWLKNKVPVIVNWFTPGRRDYMDSEMPDGHSSVVAGIDDEKIYLQDPEIGGIREIPRKEFLRVWFDFPGAAITKPEDIILRQIIIIRPKE
ncbi:MAG: hypothetical protein A2931_00995 [Candidatus Niyogibacteria bacterium RIFCSPLOWO2_01_FULL_45_48]|uniref:Peptidase C39 domain-containing protein n=2 Tax=Candidatus Niyogiibacteriota TaxID=1817912 RepID=A0A1G2F049_9BACT|nr:MAG: hypothetical protein A2931_00995 [Candidatus Niyogibacteria bacterium RIFCSPLOWO2_01_FULL_45_48]OGZ30838.1 MAG: hypothetical protein A2835_00960 [Candidatus Niyogibacteria bacterium RIFCSPHIGHO2_01_FULL_45_28]OGZ31464.1 MAG: hypothetical protein A3J00_02480 [Candidatus Niyogibacteria bacterium RIFCSPLOWO2_02_FULL_45_13]